MDDAALRRTIRRCTAMVLVALGLLIANTDPYDPSNSLGYPLAYVALAYLGLSVLGGVLRSLDGSSEPFRPDGDSASDGANDGGSGPDGGEDGDDEDDESTDERPNKSPVGLFDDGHW